MERKNTKGVFTSEFWGSLAAAGAAIIAPIIAIIVGRGLVTSTEGELIMAVVTGVLGLAVMIVPAWIAVRYTQSRSAIKKG